MDAGPWYATGLFTLLGVVVAHAAGVWSAKTRTKYEDARRWHAERRELYLRAAQEIRYIERAIYDRFEAGAELPADLKDRVDGVFRILDEVHLIGSADVVRQLEGMSMQVWAAYEAAPRGVPGKALDRCDDLRHMGYRFKDLARADLTNDRQGLKKWSKRRPR